jgi:hypothetical protein
MLTRREKERVRMLFVRGPTHRTDGFPSVKEADKFWRRVEVRNELARLVLEFNEQEGMMDRVRFINRRGLSLLSERSLRVLQRALHGPRYAHTPEGHVVMDVMNRPVVAEAGPTAGQVQVAQDVLDRLGVVKDADSRGGTEVNLNVLLSRGQAELPNISYATGAIKEDQKAASREKMRWAIQKLLPVLGPAHKEIEVLMRPKPVKKKGKVKGSVSPGGATPPLGEAPKG